MPPGISDMKRPVLTRLVVNVSHDCNLRCRYCYADAGCYGGPRGFLSLNTGKRLLDYFFSMYDAISTVQFFGGEPLLSPDVLEALCIYVLKTCRKRNISPPVFALVTNGTIVNDAILSAISKYRMQVVVSLDGPAAINDLLRVTARGSGTFKKVTANILRMKQATGQPVKIEGAFTAEHLRREFSLADFMDYLVRDLDIHSIHMPWILGECYNGLGIVPGKANLEKMVEIYSKAIHKSIGSLVRPGIDETILVTQVERYLLNFFGRGYSGKYVCPAGGDTLAVSADGDIYPCSMFVNKKKFRLGTPEMPFSGLRENMKRFCRGMQVTARGRLMKPSSAFCAGLNYESCGSLNRISSPERTLQERLDTYLRRELDALLKDQETADWIKIKLLFNQINVRELEEASA